MNDFVLLGFCQKCENSFGFHDQKKGYTCYNDTLENYIAHDIVWFLSPKQMKIINEHPSALQRWGRMDKYFDLDFEPLDILIAVLEHDPFLVAKILFDEEKKQKEAI